MPGIILNHKTAATAYLFLLMALALAATVMLTKHGATGYGATFAHGAKPDTFAHG